MRPTLGQARSITIADLDAYDSNLTREDFHGHLNKIGKTIHYDDHYDLDSPYESEWSDSELADDPDDPNGRW